MTEYLIHFDICGKINGWTDQEKAQYLSVSLKGNAQKLLSTLKAKQLEDFQAIVQALNERFGSDGQAELFMTQLETRAKSDKESYQELSDSISRLVVKAYPTAPHDMVTILTLRYFIEAVKDPDLRIKLKLEKLTNIRDAVLLAINYDAIQNAEKSKQSKPKRNHVRQVKASPKAKSKSQKTKNTSQDNLASETVQRVIKVQDNDHTSKIVTELSDRIERLEKIQQYSWKSFQAQT